MKLWNRIKCFFGFHEKVIDRCYTSIDHEKATGKKPCMPFAEIERHCKHCGFKETGWII